MKIFRYLVIAELFWTSFSISHVYDATHFDDNCSEALIQLMTAAGTKTITPHPDWKPGVLHSLGVKDSRHYIREKLSYEEFERLLKLATQNVFAFEAGWTWMEGQPKENHIYMFGGLLRNIIRDMNQFLKDHSPKNLEAAILGKALQPAFDLKDVDILVPKDLAEDISIFPNRIVIHMPRLRGAVPEFKSLHYELLPHNFYHAALAAGGIAIDKVAVNPKAILDPYGALKAYYDGWLPVITKPPVEFWKSTYPVDAHFFRTQSVMRMVDVMSTFPEASVPRHMLRKALKATGEDFNLEHGLTPYANEMSTPDAHALIPTVKKAMKAADHDLMRFFELVFETGTIKLYDEFRIPGFDRDQFKGLPSSTASPEEQTAWYNDFRRELLKSFSIEEITMIDKWIPLSFIASGKWPSHFLMKRTRFNLVQFAMTPRDVLAIIRNLDSSLRGFDDEFLQTESVQERFFSLKPSLDDFQILAQFTSVSKGILDSYVERAVKQRIVTKREAKLILEQAGKSREEEVDRNMEKYENSSRL